MRVLLAAHAFPPRSLAGVEVYSATLAAELARSHDVRIVYAVRDANRPDRAVDRVELGGGLVGYEVTTHGRFDSFEETHTGARLAGALASVMDEFRPDVVHAQHIEGLGSSWLVAAAGRGSRVFMTVHDHVLTCANGGQRFHPTLGRCPTLDLARCATCTAHMNRIGLATRRLARRRREHRATDRPTPTRAAAGSTAVELGRSLMARLDRNGERRIVDRTAAMRRLADTFAGFIAPSRFLEHDLLAFGLPREKLHYIPHGLDPSRFGRRQPANAARRFGYLGSIVPHKGIEVLIAAFRDMPPDAELAVAGSHRADPAHAAHLAEIAKSANVRFEGEVDHAAVPDWLADIDCLVVPSIWEENAPLVVLEAFASGVPVIASRLGGLPELVDPGGGVTFSPGSVDALRRALRSARDGGTYRQWVETIPTVPRLEDHVADLVAVYRGRDAKRLEP